MNAEGQHERQRMGPAKCQRAGSGLETRAPATITVAGAITVGDDVAPPRLVVDARKIKKERNFPDAGNENGAIGAMNNVAAGNADVGPGNTENGHQSSRSNSVCRTSSNGFNSGDILHDIIAAKLGQTSGIHGNASKNDKIRIMIEDSLTEDSKNRVQEIYLKVEQLKHEEKLLLYLRMPASLTNAGGSVDPLRQPLNPLGNRYEIHQTIMWIKTHLEEDPDVSLPKQEVYDEYNMFCIRNSMKPLSTADFGKVMKQVYPRVRPRRLGTRGNSRYCYAGMRKRVKLDTPTLPAVTDTSMPDDFEEPITEEMLGAASTLIREWAESLLKMKFPTLSALARHLVDNLRVDTRSLAAVCILCASGDGRPSSNKETSPSLSVTPIPGKPGKLREAQLQLQRKLQQREHTRDNKHRPPDAGPPTPIKDRPPDVVGLPSSTSSSASRPPSSSKSCKKTKTSQSPHPIATSGPTGSSGPSTPITSGKIIQQTPSTTIPPPTTTRTRKFPRSSSQTSSASSPQPHCDNQTTFSRSNDEIRSGNGRSSRSCTPGDANVPRDPKIPSKTSRKRSSLESNHQLTESSPEKLPKLIDDSSIGVKIEDSGKMSTKFQQTTEPTGKNLPITVKISKIDETSKSPTKRSQRSKDCETANEKPSNGRSSTTNDAVSSLNRFDEKLCTIDPDALDDYLNGGNNSQEQEEELLQYFQQSSSSSSDAEPTNSSSNPETDRTSRSDKVSQLRLILQQNLKASTARPQNSSDSTIATTILRRETPIVEKKPSTMKHHEIILPILLNHNANQTSGSTRRRVSFETSVVEQHNENSGIVSSNFATGNTIPQSPNTRRRIFNFTPISPGPHSPINVRTSSVSKPNSANASPFVSPRNTPVPRSRSNLQSGVCRSRQKNFARSMSCSVPYTARNETFVVPTSNSENTRISTVSQTIVNSVKPITDVRTTGNNVRGSQIVGDDERKVIGCAASFLAGADLNPQKQLFINYPSQENLQEIKNVYGNFDGSMGTTISGHRSRNSQPADQEITELLNGSKQQHFSTEQFFYRSQSVPLHRMVNPNLMSPMGDHQHFVGSFNGQSFNRSSNSSVAPTPVPSEFNDFGGINATEAYLLDDVDGGFIPDDQQFTMEDKDSITKILNILDEEGCQNLTIIPEAAGTDETLMETGVLPISILDPITNNDMNIPNESIMDPAVVLDPSVGVNKIPRSRSYTTTPLPVSNNVNYVPNASFNDENSDGSTSFPSTPLHAIQPDVYRESNEPMLSSPTLNSLNLRTDNGETAVSDNVCRNVADLLETNFLGDGDGDSDDLGHLGNFDGLQDVDSLAPLFNEVADNNR